jgi:hypothetical protein
MADGRCQRGLLCRAGFKPVDDVSVRDQQCVTG